MLQDVVVRPNLAKENTLNKMVLTGGRMFSVEEASRYAGGFDDPARLASSFSGVATSGATNGISIHGNAPHLLSWRLEDIEIPNPNHFSDISVLGGGIFSSLSAMCIGNSDFLTSAFPAEYGNAVSGVFDMKMRNGNDQKYEHAFQIGVAGIDVASEGPLSKKTGASYLVNYRYSMTGLASRMKMIDMQGQVMDYQDLNFKFNIPTRKAGTFTVWGTGFFDHFHRESSPKDWDSKYDESYSFSDQWMGAMGVGHVLLRDHVAALRELHQVPEDGCRLFHGFLRSDDLHGAVPFDHVDMECALDLCQVLIQPPAHVALMVGGDVNDLFDFSHWRDSFLFLRKMPGPRWAGH